MTTSPFTFLSFYYFYIHYNFITEKLSMVDENVKLFLYRKLNFFIYVNVCKAITKYFTVLAFVNCV